jgi:hypothetical protein
MKTTEIVDIAGAPLVPGAIVEMSDSDGPWSEYQGLVMVPDSEIEDQGYSVAVFFDNEVSESRFGFCHPKKDSGILSFRDWDSRYGRLNIDEKKAILLNDDFWKRCPRVQFFRPEELKVVPFWKTKNLAKRLFGNRYHTVYTLLYDLPPTAFMCWCVDCQNQAEKLALYNFWGTVYSYYVCQGCFEKINGICGESCPEIKKPILLTDGSVFQKKGTDD